MQSDFLFWHDPLFKQIPLIERFTSSIVSITETSDMATIGEFTIDQTWNLHASNHMLVFELR